MIITSILEFKHGENEYIVHCTADIDNYGYMDTIYEVIRDGQKISIDLVSDDVYNIMEKMFDDNIVNGSITERGIE